MLARAAAMRASGECATAVIGFRKRTASELLEFVVVSAQLKEMMAIGTVSLFVCAVANRKRGTVDEGPHWGSTGGVASTVGVCQGRDADTQGLTRRVVKRGQTGMHSRVTECWHVPSLKSNREGLHCQSGRAKEETLTPKG